MALSSISIDIHRDDSRSRSPLSPTLIHYHQKYQSSNIERHHRFQKQYRNSPIRHQYYNKKTRRITKRRQSFYVWERHRSSNGRIYYYNIITDRSQWEKPPRDQFLSTSMTNKSPNKHSIYSKRSLNDHKSKKSTHFNSISDDDDYDLTYSRSINNNKTKDNHKQHRRRKNKIEIFPHSPKDKVTPTSPPPNEIIRIDLVDPIPTPNISMSSIHSHNQDIFKSFHSHESIKTPFNQNSSLYPSASTINAILQLEHSHSNSNDITRYYRSELIEHLLNWPSTQIERETIRLSNEQTRIRLYQLISLRTELFSLRLRFERNRFQLLEYCQKS